MVAKGSERLGVLCVSLAFFPLNIMAASRPQTHGLPAKAGIHLSAARAAERWVPAFAGTPKISAFSLL
jgi:hypothetical protein